jgi:hypothetical protein
MRYFKAIVRGALAVGLLAPVCAVAQDNGKPFVSLNMLIDQISKAKTPSDAVAAYAQAYKETGDSISTNRAFVARMIDFGVPDMATTQAQSLSANVNEGMPWAVLAFASARADKLGDAVMQIQTAAKMSPNDEFVVRTAGQILAWYDVRQPTADFPQAVQTAAEDVRERLGSRKVFNDAYDDIHDPLDSLYNSDEQGGGVVLANTDLATLGAFSGASRSAFNSPMALFYAAPYAIFPGYGYWYQPLGANVYYYQDWWRRGVGPGRIFPFPAVGRDTRFLRLPSGGFALVSDDGANLYSPLNGPIYGGYYTGAYGYGPVAPYYGNNITYIGGGFPVFSPGFGGGRRFGGGGFGGGGGPVARSPGITPSQRLYGSNGFSVRGGPIDIGSTFQPSPFTSAPPPGAIGGRVGGRGSGGRMGGGRGR